MAFTNRWICNVDGNYDFDEKKEELKNFFNEIDGEENQLRSIINLEPEITFEDYRCVHGKLYHQLEEERSDFDITDDKRLNSNVHLVRNTYVVDFWNFSNNTIFFRKTGQNIAVKYAKKMISNILVGDEDKIKNFTYDIKKIEDDVNSGILGGMWTFSFRDRLGNIQSGTAYGDEIDHDPMYRQVKTAPKKYIGIKKLIGDENLKISIFKGGTFRIYLDLEEVSGIPTLFNTINEFNDYVIID